jgi:hypothetical protein
MVYIEGKLKLRFSRKIILSSSGIWPIQDLPKQKATPFINWKEKYLASIGVHDKE